MGVDGAIRAQTRRTCSQRTALVQFFRQMGLLALIDQASMRDVVIHLRLATSFMQSMGVGQATVRVTKRTLVLNCACQTVRENLMVAPVTWARLTVRIRACRR